MATLFMVLIEFNLENYLSQDLLVTFKLKNQNMEEILMFLFLNLKLPILLLILQNMISLWWALMVYLIKWKINKLHNNFGHLETNQFHHLKLMIQKVKNYHLLEKQLQKLLLKRWKICHSIILLLYSLFSIVKKDF